VKRIIHWGSVALVALAAVAGCDDGKAGQGQPSATATEAAKARGPAGSPCQTNEDCENGLGCSDDKKCLSYKTIECRGRGDACKSDGLCTGENNICVAGTNADCQGAQVCAKYGQCSAKDGKCVAASAEDCKQRCKEVGLCAAEDGKCVAKSADDCKQSEACTKYKKCTFKSGGCTTNQTVD
jgi:hypothetical protein